MVSFFLLLYLFEGLVDALELFGGLITFADSKAEDKLRCKTPSD